jgi:hypothetical protein
MHQTVRRKQGIKKWMTKQSVEKELTRERERERKRERDS